MYGAQIFSKFINIESKHNRAEIHINLHASHGLMSTAPAVAKPPPPASSEHGDREGSRYLFGGLDTVDEETMRHTQSKKKRLLL
jgi:hypothetical protein